MSLSISQRLAGFSYFFGCFGRTPPPVVCWAFTLIVKPSSVNVFFLYAFPILMTSWRFSASKFNKPPHSYSSQHPTIPMTTISSSAVALAKSAPTAIFLSLSMYVVNCCGPCVCRKKSFCLSMTGNLLLNSSFRCVITDLVG